jgi:dTDP-4-dehydrorhamnose reductase
VRILILGGDGMLGHQLLNYLAARHETRVTLHQDLSSYASLGLFHHGNTYASIDVRSVDRLTEVVADFRPQVVINAIGIVKQRPTSLASLPSLEINSLLPHRLAVLCKAVGARLVHISTDCVFSGRKGNYQENDPSDAEDLYGKSKYLGELHDSHCLTLRTSIIGRELIRKNGLLEWFLSQKTPVKGYRHAIFSGFTTLEIARIIERMLLHYPQASGVYQVSSEPITKYALLLLFREILGHGVEIVPDEVFHCDRSLDSSRFRREFNYSPPSWERMIEELKPMN